MIFLLGLFSCWWSSKGSCCWWWWWWRWRCVCGGSWARDGRWTWKLLAKSERKYDRKQTIELMMHIFLSNGRVEDGECFKEAPMLYYLLDNHFYNEYIAVRWLSECVCQLNQWYIFGPTLITQIRRWSLPVSATVVPNAGRNVMLQSNVNITRETIIQAVDLYYH